MSDRREEFAALIAKYKPEMFVRPDDESDAEAAGIVVAHWADWTGETIVEAFVSALSDANYHEFASAVLEAWEVHE